MLGDGEWELVFCDVRLSDKSESEGFVVLRRFVEEQPEAQIVLMTGHGSAAGALDATAGGAYDYLLKPFGANDVLALAHAVRERLKRPAGREETDHAPSAPVYTSDID